MIRTIVTYLITALLLLMNIQAVMGKVSEVFHQHSNVEIVASSDTDVHTDDVDEDSHCQHCCHTHASNLFVHGLTNHQSFSSETHFYHLIGKSGPAPGPPTPPPNV